MPAMAEEEAYQRAVRWVGVDDHYQDKEITPREQALMRLAIRCLWAGNLVDGAITKLEVRHGGDRDPA